MVKDVSYYSHLPPLSISLSRAGRMRTHKKIQSLWNGPESPFLRRAQDVSYYEPFKIMVDRFGGFPRGCWPLAYKMRSPAKHQHQKFPQSPQATAILHLGISALNRVRSPG